MMVTTDQQRQLMMVSYYRPEEAADDSLVQQPKTKVWFYSYRPSEEQMKFSEPHGQKMKI